MERCSKNHAKQPEQNENEQVHRVVDALKQFQQSQRITPEIHNEQEMLLKSIQQLYLTDCQMPLLLPRQFVSVRILNFSSPRQIYLIKNCDEQDAATFHEDLNQLYTRNEYDLVYCLKPGIICVARSSAGWQRCRILKLHENHSCDALLFDIGKIERIDWYNFRMIDNQLVNANSLNPIGIRCELVSIETAEPFARFSLNAFNRFQQILLTERDLYIFANRPDPISTHIFLYYKRDDQFHCVNDIFSTDLGANESAIEEVSSEAFNPPLKELPMKLEHIQQSTPLNRSAESKPWNISDTSSPTHFEPFKKSEQSPLVSFLESVIVRHVVSPDEIYICFQRYAVRLNELVRDIRMYIEEMALPSPFDPMKQILGEKKQVWNVDDLCLAVDPASNLYEWLRARIVTIGSLGNCSVFLRDVGKTIECHLTELKPINQKLGLIRDFTWKVKLASVKLTQNCSSRDLVKLLVKLMESYDKMAISAINDENEYECGVMLWGVLEECHPLLPVRNKYISVNEELVKHGVVTTEMSFKKIEKFLNSEQKSKELAQKSFDQDCENIADTHFSRSGERDDVKKQLKPTNKITEVKRWLPSEPIEKKTFVAFPVYFSQQCVIHVLEGDRKTAADEMLVILDKKYHANELKRKDATKWEKDDACFARFSYDNLFYRATLRRVNFATNTCLVRFVDYGNCEKLKLDDLKEATMFGDIPILSRQYKLHNIQPTTETGIWPEHVRDFCIALAHDKHCNLVVIDKRSANGTHDGIEMCRLDLLTKHKDLASALIARGYATYIDESKD